MRATPADSSFRYIDTGHALPPGVRISSEDLQGRSSPAKARACAIVQPAGGEQAGSQSLNHASRAPAAHVALPFRVRPRAV